MENVLTSLLPTLGGPAIAIIIVIYLYLKINRDRKDTKLERDKDSIELHDKILKHDFELTSMKDQLAYHRTIQDDLAKQINILSESVAKFSVAVDNLTESIKEIKSDLKERK